MNESILIGRLTMDPVVNSYGKDGKIVVNVSLAVDRDYKDTDGNSVTDFIDCVAFGQPADFISNYISKGRLVAISGSIQTESYEKEGQKRKSTKVRINRIKTLDAPKEGTSKASKPKEEDTEFDPFEGG